MTPNRPFKYCGDINYSSNPASGEKGWYQADVYESDEADAIFDAKEAEIAELVEALVGLRSFMWSEGFSDLNVPMARVDEVLDKYAAPPDTSNGEPK